VKISLESANNINESSSRVKRNKITKFSVSKKDEKNVSEAYEIFINLSLMVEGESCNSEREKFWFISSFFA
jgi:hypothetical protein